MGGSAAPNTGVATGGVVAAATGTLAATRISCRPDTSIVTTAAAPNIATSAIALNATGVTATRHRARARELVTADWGGTGAVGRTSATIGTDGLASSLANSESGFS